MTITFPDASENSIFSTSTELTAERRRLRKVAGTPSSIVEVESRRSDWRPTALRKVADFLAHEPNLRLDTAERFINWMLRIPRQMPSPFISVGDDGTLSAEWDVHNLHFHVSFDGMDDEGYFFNDSGGEFEFADLAEHTAVIRRILVALMGATANE